MSNIDDSNPSHDPDSETRESPPAAESESEYDSALKPLLWLLIPFLAVLGYGLFG